MNLSDQIDEAVRFLNNYGIRKPELGVVLGTGLGKLADEVVEAISIPYENVPHFPLATVEFHDGKLIYGKLAGKRVLLMQGRFHYYEGYSMIEVAFPIRVMRALGIESLFLSGAAGSMNLDWNKGELMLVNDHINLQPTNPLIGPNDDNIGPRFPDMSETYLQSYRQKLLELASERGIILRSGVYVSVPGPMLETASEYRFLRNIGADVVGMSTVPEVIAARHAGMSCVAIIVLTDDCDPDNLSPISIPDILESAAAAEEQLILLIKDFVTTLE